MLFYLAYHIEAPLVSKLTIRLINRLELSSTRSLSTPFDVEYINITFKYTDSSLKKALQGVQV